MSTGLMSCVRENSPPIDMAVSESGAFSLPNNASDTHKRRRFHPLRNLRRIFRRRTLSGADTLRRSVSSTPSSQASVSASTTTTPPTVIASVPAQSTLCSQEISPVDVTAMSSAAYPPHPINLAGNRDVGSCGLTTTTAVPPYKITTSASGGFYVKSSRSGTGGGGGIDNHKNLNAFNRGGHEPIANTNTGSSNNQDMEESRGDMMDCQRSLSEGRLVDSDYSKDTLSQSRDSVFSESATASSLSLGLKAELFDVLRKRRNRPDASEEDLGLPRSPATPQRNEHVVNQSEVSSLSLLSMASSELDDELTTTNYAIGDKTNSSYSSSRYSFESSRTSDEIDLDISAGSRLSHSAAHHKMAVRPKKKRPTGHRRPIEASVLPSTPEVNEDTLKLSTPDIKDSIFEKQKTKSHSLPPGVNAKILEHHGTTTVKETSSSIKRSKTEACSVSASCVVQSIRNESDMAYHSSQASTLERKDDENGFFKRFLHRSSKKMKRSMDEGDHADETSPLASLEHFESFETKNETKSMRTSTEMKEYGGEIKSGLVALLNSMAAPSGHEQSVTQEPTTIPKSNKPKSGPASRQRIQPQDLTSPLPPEDDTDPMSSAMFIENEKKTTIGPTVKASSFEKLPSITITSRSSTEDSRIPIRAKPKDESTASSVPTILLTYDHFEKRDTRIQPKIVGLSPFQQKISRVDNTTSELVKPIPKQRKSVEKSKSFRYYTEAEDTTESNLKKRDNMPSLPDLTCSSRNREENDDVMQSKLPRPEPASIPMGFEINDNNLIKLKRHEELQRPHTPTSIYTKNIILSPTKPLNSPICNKNITEIEENIDKLVKSPFITVLKSEELNDVRNVSNISTTIIRQMDTIETKSSTGSVQIRTKALDKKKSASAELLSMPEVTPKARTKSESSEPKVTVMTTERNSFDKKSVALDLSEAKAESRSKDNIATTPTKLRRSSAFFEKVPADNVNVPEFMKIQLNRVDSTRPKTNVVLSKNAKETDDRDMTRRFSNESVEITDTKPPLPPEASTALKRNSTVGITKVTEDVGLKSPVKKPPDDIIPPKPPTKTLVDEENNVLRNSENSQPPVLAPAVEQHQKESKPKYIKKSDDGKSEKRKSVIESNREVIERETGVVLRKKSFSTSNKEDTPELMKVFARRSLKIKDTEDIPNFEETTDRGGGLLKKSGNLDSDKENQSSSEEKLDKLPKVEITIQQPKSSLQNGSQPLQKQDEKNRTSTVGEIFRKPNTTATLINTTTPKPFVQPMRFSSVSTYRSMSSVFADSKKQSNPLITMSSLSTSPPNTVEQITADENERNNNGNHSTTTSTTTTATITTTNNRHTISCTSPAAATKLMSRDDGEFKGILQRRAEWEKRAKEASK